MRNFRLFILTVAVLLCRESPAQAKGATWREYSFPEDGFAILLPEAPRKHPDTNIPDTTAYSVTIDPDHAFTLRVRRESRTCDSVLAQLRDGVLSGKARGSDPSSLKDVPLNRYPGLEYEWSLSEERTVRERYYCGEGRIYILAVGREKKQAMLPAASKIINSFRLLPAGRQQ